MDSRVQLRYRVRSGWLLLFRLVLPLQVAAATSAALPPQNQTAEVQRQIAAHVPDAAGAIEVKQAGGRIVLEGTVGNLAQRWEAEAAAQGVRGVEDVVNRIRVAGLEIEDAKIREDVYWALRADPATMALGIEVQVRDGVVTLGGVVDTVPQTRIAEWVASDRVGVREVVNQIRVSPQRRSDDDLQAELQAHYASNLLFNDDEIQVRVHDGAVELAGHVDTALEKNWARADAWARGARQVNVERLAIKPDDFSTPASRHQGLTDVEIRRAIVRAAVNDPRVASVNPEVKVENGIVVLEGKVANLRAKRAMAQIARETGGVREVRDRLQLESPGPRTDAQLKEVVLNALHSSAALAGNDLIVDAAGSHVVLRGTVDSVYEQWLAADLAERAAGVSGVENRTTIRNPEGRNAPRFLPRGGAATPWTFGPRAGGGSERTSQASP